MGGTTVESFSVIGSAFARAEKKIKLMQAIESHLRAFHSDFIFDTSPKVYIGGKRCQVDHLRVQYLLMLDFPLEKIQKMDKSLVLYPRYQ